MEENRMTNPNPEAIAAAAVALEHQALTMYTALGAAYANVSASWSRPGPSSGRPLITLSVSIGEDPDDYEEQDS
jgi:hypothetical protein